MKIIKTNHINLLIDVYGELLTENQLNTIKDYYFFDLSLSEIAENNNISRAAVLDNIKRTINKLENFESKLQIIKRKEMIFSLLENKNIKLNEKIEKIKEIL